MKKSILYIFFAALAVVMFTSCQKAYQDNYFLAVDHAGVDFPYTKGHSYIQVYSTGNWAVSVEASASSWCHLDKSSGSGRGSFRIDVDDNLSGYDRTAVVSVTRDNECKQITVKQKTVE